MIGINAQITSQLTSEEICEHIRNVLAVFDASEFTGTLAQRVAPEQIAAMRTQLIGQCVATCGRPISKLEREQIAEAQKMIREKIAEQDVKVPATKPKTVEDSPFLKPVEQTVEV